MATSGAEAKYASGYTYHDIILIVSAVVTTLCLIFSVSLASVHLSNWVKPKEQKQYVPTISFNLFWLTSCVLQAGSSNHLYSNIRHLQSILSLVLWRIMDLASIPGALRMLCSCCNLLPPCALRRAT